MSWILHKALLIPISLGFTCCIGEQDGGLVSLKMWNLVGYETGCFVW